MSVEAVRIWADWLADAGSAGHGVNAVLATVPRDAGDPLPASVTVYDETRHGWVARGLVSREAGGITYPAVAVYVLPVQESSAMGFLTSPHQAGGGADRATVQDGYVVLAAEWLDQQADTAAAAVAASYTLRAVRGSLHLLHASVIANRTRNGVQLVQPVESHVVKRLEFGDDVTVRRIYAVKYRTRETLPTP